MAVPQEFNTNASIMNFKQFFIEKFQLPNPKLYRNCEDDNLVVKFLIAHNVFVYV